MTAEETGKLVDELAAETRQLEERYSVEAVQWLRDRLAGPVVESWDDVNSLQWLIERAAGPQQARIVLEFCGEKPRESLPDSAFDKLDRLLECKPIDEDTASWLRWAVWLRLLGQILSGRGSIAYGDQPRRRRSTALDGARRVLENSLGRYSEAEAAYRAAIQADPNLASAWRVSDACC